jgi:hypothetical protein
MGVCRGQTVALAAIEPTEVKGVGMKIRHVFGMLALSACGQDGNAQTTARTPSVTPAVAARPARVAHEVTPEGLTKMKIVRASASAAEDRADNIFDGETAPLDGNGWSAKGDGQWISLDLGDVTTVSRVRIAFFRPAAKPTAYNFEIQVSTDGNSFRTVLKQTSHEEGEWESFDFSATASRYVRYLGHGSKTRPQNSLMEIEVWGPARRVIKKAK